MMEESAEDIAQLVQLLESPPSGQPITILLGAAASLASGLPAAVPWKRLLLHCIRDRATMQVTDDDLHMLATSAAVPLESIFELIEGRQPGLGVCLVQQVGSAPYPNELHRLVAEALERGRVRAVVTTNFDDLLERSLGPVGYERRWVVSQPWSPGNYIYKPHGSADIPESLRFTFRTINVPFPSEVALGLGELGSGTIVALGYEGADYDLLGPMSSGGTVHWLQPSYVTRGPAEGVRRLRRSRRIRVVVGGFSELLDAMSRPRMRVDPVPAKSFEEGTRHLLQGLSTRDAILVLDALMYRGHVGNKALAVGDLTFLEELRGLQMIVGDVHLWRARAARAQYSGGSLARGPALGAFYYLRAALAETDLASRRLYLSDAADCAERIGMGFGALWSRLTIGIHKRAELSAAADARPLLLFRQARCEAMMGRHARADTCLTQAIEQGLPLDVYTEGIILRRRALARAQIQDPRWASDVSRARDLLAFEGRSGAYNDLLRAEAVCAAVSGGARQTVQDLLMEARQNHRDAGQRGGVARCTILLGATAIPLAWRATIRFLA